MNSLEGSILTFHFSWNKELSWTMDLNIVSCSIELSNLAPSFQIHPVLVICKISIIKLPNILYYIGPLDACLSSKQNSEYIILWLVKNFDGSVVGSMTAYKNVYEYLPPKRS